MTALIRYQLAALGHSQRYVPPVFLYVACLAAFYSNNSGAALPGFSLTSGALLVVAGWLTISLVDVEDGVQRLVTRTHAGSSRYVLAGLVLTVLLCGCGLTVLAVAWAMLSGPGYTATDAGIGALTHLICASAGIAVALPCSGLLVQRIGYSALLATGVLAAVLLVPWIPLVHPLLLALNHGQPSSSLLLRSTAFAVLVLVASPVLVARVRPRQ